MDVLGTITITSVSSILTYILGRNRTKKEVDNLSLLNLEKSVEIYRTILVDMENQIVTLNKKIDELETKIDELVKENHELKKMLSRNANSESKI